MSRKSKRFREIAKLYDPQKVYNVDEAIAILKKAPPIKCDQSVECALRTGVDSRKSDQQVRGTVSLPNGTGKTLIILVFAKGEKEKEAKAAGADFVGNDELFAKVQAGWTDFDAVIATPDMMREVGKLGKVLGPRGLMPTPKAGTVTQDVSKAIAELKAGKVEFKTDRHGVINGAVGRLAFDSPRLRENIAAYLMAIQRAKPATAKGIYLKSLVISSTMGPGIKVDMREGELA